MYYDEIPEVVVMNAEQQRFIDVNARITGIYAQMNAANNVDAEESGRREIERLTAAMADVQTRLTDEELAGCRDRMNGVI